MHVICFDIDIFDVILSEKVYLQRKYKWFTPNILVVNLTVVHLTNYFWNVG